MAAKQQHKSLHTLRLDVEHLEGRTLLSVAKLDPISYFFGDRSGITQGPDSHMWLIDEASDRIRKISGDGDVREFTFPGAVEGERLDLGSDIAAGPDGKLWFGVRDRTGWRLARVSTDGVLEIVSPGETQAIEQVEAGTDGGVWFSRFGGKIGRIDETGQITLVSAEGLSDVFDLEAGPDGTMWFSGYGRIGGPAEAGTVGWKPRHDLIGKISSGGVVEQFPTTGFSYITDIVAAADGFIYFGANNALGRVSINGEIKPIALPGIRAVDLTARPDGVWFVDLSNPLNPIAKVKDDGSISHFSAKGPSHPIHGLARGVDGKLWYTTGAENTVRKFNPDAGLAGRAVRLNVEHKVRFSHVVASFTDSKNAGAASDYEATIDWGNGETTAGEIVPNDDGGFDVVGANKLKWGWHTLRIAITDKRTDGRDLKIDSVAYAVPASIAGKGRTVEPTAGQMFKGTVATYIGPDVDDLARYTARINWGDHESSVGKLVVGSNGEIKVVGTHLYLRPGQYDIYVTIEETGATNFPTDSSAIRTFEPVTSNAGFTNVIRTADLWPQPIDRIYNPVSPFNDARSRAVVKAGVVDGDLLLPDVYVGERFNQVIARFETTEDDASIAHYRAVVDLGGELLDGVIEATGDGEFVVRLSHVFTNNNGRHTTVRIYDDRRPDDYGTIGVVAGEIWARRHLSVDPVAISATSGAEFDGKLGTIESIGSGADWQSEFNIVIHWGDQTESPGRVVSRGDGRYDVYGTHTYEVVGYHRDLAISVEVHETRRPLAAGLPAGPFEYSAVGYPDSDERSHVSPGRFGGLTLRDPRSYSYGARAGEPFGMRVAVMTVGDSSIPIADYQGVVKWDDGTESQVRFERAAEHADVYYVHTTHTFATAGNYTGVVTVRGAGDEESIEVRLNVYQPTPPQKAPVASVMGDHDLSAVDDVEFSGAVGWLRPRDPGALPSDFTVTIHWGDGRSSPGILEPLDDGRILIRVEHVFRLTQDNTDKAHEWYSIHVRTADEVAHGSGRVEVAKNPAKLYADGRPMHFRQRQEFTAKVATFTSPDGDAAPGDFEAWIEWGDGTRTRGVVTRGHRDTFEVAGTHTYEQSGYMAVEVTVTGPGGTDLAASGMQLDPDPVVVKSPKPHVDGLTISGRIATFVDEDGKSTDPEAYRVFHAALIDWGDGEITFGLVGERDDGSYEVIGSHTYKQAGEYTVSLVVRRNTRYLPKVPSWYRGQHRSYDLHFLDTTAYGRGDAAQPSGKKDEFGKNLFTVRVKKPKKGTPPKNEKPKCRRGEKPKRDNCRAPKNKKDSRPAQRAIAMAASTSLFSQQRIPRTLSILG